MSGLSFQNSIWLQSPDQRLGALAGAGNGFAGILLSLRPGPESLVAGFPIVRVPPWDFTKITTVFWSLYWDTPIYGDYLAFLEDGL